MKKDRELLERYVAVYSDELTRLCICLCRNTSDAEDLFQDTWCKAFRNFDKYDVSKPFDKWLYAICVNTYKNNVKLWYNSRRMCFSSDEEQEFFINSIPDDSVHSSDEYVELHKIICSLPKNQRIVIILKYFRDFTIEDIAQMLSIPEGTVKSRLHSAKATIRRRFALYE